MEAAMARFGWVAAGGFVIGVAAAAALADGPKGSGQLRIVGEVPAVCTVSVAERGATLDLARGVERVPVATVEERCNTAAGYSVTLSTQNGGQLRTDNGAAGGAAGVPYTITYDGATQAGGSMVANRPASPQPQSRELSVSAAAPDKLQAGTYQDTITVTIAGK